MTIGELLEILDILKILLIVIVSMQFLILGDLSFIHSKLVETKLAIYGYRLIGFAMIGIGFIILLRGI